MLFYLYTAHAAPKLRIIEHYMSFLCCSLWLTLATFASCYLVFAICSLTVSCLFRLVTGPKVCGTRDYIATIPISIYMYIWYIRTNEAIDVIVCEHIQNVIESIKKEKCNAKPKYTKRYTQTQPFNMQNRANHEKKWHRADCGVRKRIQQTQTHTHLNNKQREKRRDSTCQNHMPTNTDRPTVWSFCCVDVRPSAILLFVSMCTSLLRIESFTHRVLLVAAFQLLYNLILRVCERRARDWYVSYHRHHHRIILKPIRRSIHTCNCQTIKRIHSFNGIYCFSVVKETEFDQLFKFQKKE